MKDWRRETIGGMTTFLTMSYIVALNPLILSSPGTGMSFSGTLTATVLICFLMTLLMGLYANLPFAVAPGMGINAFFAYSLILGRQIPWPVALGLVFWAGVLFLLVSVTPLRMHVAKAIPMNLRLSAAAGIGVFLTFIGLKNAGLVEADPVTFVRFGHIDGKAVLSISGLFLMAALQKRKNPFAFLVGIIGITAVAAGMHWIALPTQFFAAPDFQSVFLKLDIWGALKLSLLPAILVVLFTDLLDSISTFVSVSHATGLVDGKGNPYRLKEGLIVDAFATLGAGLFGTSSGTAYIESTAGIEAGGRTGLASVVTALCFLPCFFLSPLAGIIPAYATAPVLILVGASMFRTVGDLSIDTVEDRVPAFLTLALIPLTFSITQGVLVGIVSHTVLYCFVGRYREIPKSLFCLAIICFALLFLENGYF
jgi:adenine/guanine/hypoxanthine permease